jgi:uncharacterized membrane protein
MLSTVAASEPAIFVEIVHVVVRMIEVGGILVVVIGALTATGVFFKQLRHKVDGISAYRGYRENLGRAILLGLEFLVAADIINTVVIEPTLESVAVLSAIVLIRTFLSFALETEINGRWPWQDPHPSHRA